MDIVLLDKRLPSVLVKDGLLPFSLNCQLVICAPFLFFGLLFCFTVHKIHSSRTPLLLISRFVFDCFYLMLSLVLRCLNLGVGSLCFCSSVLLPVFPWMILFYVIMCFNVLFSAFLCLNLL